MADEANHPAPEARPLAEEHDDLAEAVARLIDPQSWLAMDMYLRDAQRKVRGKNASYDPAAFKDKRSIALANRIIALVASRLKSLAEDTGRKT